MSAIACGGGSPPPAAPAAPVVEGRTAERDARGLVTEIYSTISRGKTDSLFSLVSDHVVVFGPRVSDAMMTRSDALVALGPFIDPRAKKHAPLHSAGLHVAASRGGRSAWASDVVSIGGERLAITAVLSNSDDIWAVSAAALAEAPTGKEVKAEAARDAIVPPGAAAAGKIDPRASAAVERFKSGLVDQKTWGDDLASQSDAVVVGPTAGDVTRGKQAIQRMWKARMRSKVREAISGELTAAMTLDAQLVWISVPVTRVADDEDPTPLRIFAVYDSDGAGWKMTALHEAIAFGEPGAGAPFKKTLPPAPPPPEPPKAASDESKPEPAAKKKPRPKKPTKKKAGSATMP